MNNKYLSIVIVNYKNFILTEKCINSVLKNIDALDYEVIVIDNNSPNESFEYLNNKFNAIETVKVINNDKNVGFGAANNLGANLANGKYIMFLNPDIIVIDDAIQKMINTMELDVEIGLVSGKLLNEDYTIQDSCRRILPISKFMMVRTPLSKLLSKEKKNKINSEYLMKDFDHNQTIEVEWVMGACILMKKEEFLSLGGFSKEYFMYFEDVDLCYKTIKSGKKLIYLHDAEMIHLHNQESSKKINRMTFIHLQSMMKFYLKYYFNRF